MSTGPDTSPATDLADGGAFAEVAAADEAAVSRNAGVADTAADADAVAALAVADVPRDARSTRACSPAAPTARCGWPRTSTRGRCASAARPHGLGDVSFGGNEDSGIGRDGIDSIIHEFVRKTSIIL